MFFAFAGALAGAQDELPAPKEPASAPSAELLQRGFDIGEMMVTPSKLTISADGSVGSLHVINRSTSVRDFRLALIELDAGDSEYHNGGELLRFGPRQFSLPPEAAQLVRVTARRPEESTELPMRARIKVSLLPKTEQQDAPPERTEQQGISLRFDGIYSISVPVDIAP